MSAAQAAAKFLKVDAVRTLDEALDPMANVLEELGPGQMAPRNMTTWISRATATVIGGIYRTMDAAAMRSEFASAMMRDAMTMTEPPKMKDASAMIIDGEMESERLNNLELAIPIPAELPVLTTSQLLELERRLGDLMSRIEDEINRAEGEERRRRDQLFEQQKREEVMTTNRFGKYITNDEWAQQMRDRIGKRLVRKHGDALPESRTRQLDAALRSPLKSKLLKPPEEEEPERPFSAQPPPGWVPGAPAAFGGGGGGHTGGGFLSVPGGGFGRDSGPPSMSASTSSHPMFTGRRDSGTGPM